MTLDLASVLVLVGLGVLAVLVYFLINGSPARERRELESGALDAELMGQPKQTGLARLLFVVACVLLLGVVAVATYFGVGEYRKLQPDHEYPRTTATITQTEVVYHHPQHGASYYELNGTFLYTVNNQPYQNVWTITTSSNQTDLEALHDVGTRATVWYDPTAPLRASNSRMGIEIPLILFGIAAVALLLSLFFLYRALSPRSDS